MSPPVTLTAQTAAVAVLDCDDLAVRLVRAGFVARLPEAEMVAMQIRAAIATLRALRAVEPEMKAVLTAQRLQAGVAIDFQPATRRCDLIWFPPE